MLSLGESRRPQQLSPPLFLPNMKGGLDAVPDTQKPDRVQTWEPRFSQHDLAWFPGTRMQTGGSTGQDGCSGSELWEGKARDGPHGGCVARDCLRTAEPFLVLGPRSHKRTMTQGVFRGVQEKKFDIWTAVPDRPQMVLLAVPCRSSQSRVELRRGRGYTKRTGVFCLTEQLGLPRQARQLPMPRPLAHIGTGPGLGGPGTARTKWPGSSCCLGLDRPKR